MDRSELLSIIEKAASYGWSHAGWDWLSVKRDLSRFLPPPPAERASGEWSRAANELRRAEALANKSNKIDRHKVIGKAANDNLSAILDALSQRPVVDEAMVERAMDALAAEEVHVFGERKTPNNGARHQCLRVALTAALAPQQPEKGEG